MQHPQGRWLACAASGMLLAGLLPLLAACGSRQSPSAGPVQTGAAAPAARPDDPVPELAQLEEQLRAVLLALGKDSSKLTAATASGGENTVFDLTLQVSDAGGQSAVPGSPQATHIGLRWTERLTGDYDHNGEVNLADLVPLSRFLRRSVLYDDPALHGGIAHWPSGSPAASPQGNPPANNWHLARVDGDGNGEVNLADILPIAKHWGERLDGYVVECGINRGNGVLDWGKLDAGGGTNYAGAVLRPAAAAPGTAVTFGVLLPLGEAHFAQSFRVRGWTYEAGFAAVHSNTVHYLPDESHDSSAPLWDDSIGLQVLVPDDGRLTAHYGSASDAQSPPVRYRVYWQAAAPEAQAQHFDYSAAQWADTFALSHAITGLDNAQHYQVAVRALDSAQPPNIEQNTAVLGRKPGPRDVYPPHWAGEHTGIANLFYGNGAAIVSWEEAFDHNEDEHGVWSSGPPNYRIYYGPGSEPDYANAAEVKIASNGQKAYVRPVSGIDTSRPHWFAVRAIDRAEFPNLDQNSRFIVGWPTETRLLHGGLPGPGPGVPPSAAVAATPRFAFDAARSTARLCIQSYTSAERWLSLYEVDGTGFSHRGDYNFSSIAANPHFKLTALALDNQSHPRLLYTRSKALGGPHVMVEYHGGSGHSVEHVIAQGPDLLSAEYGPDGALHGFWLTLDNADLAGLEMSTWYSGLPFNMETPLHKSASDPANQHLSVPAYDWCWLDDGSIVVQAELISLTTGERLQRMLTVNPDGGSTLSPAPLGVLPEGNTTLRLSRGGGGRPVTAVWGADHNAMQVAWLRQRWNYRYFGAEPGFTQLYLAHPQFGPCLRVIDMDNFAVARTLSTTLQAGAGGTERIYHCLHYRWAGRETIVPLPFIQTGAYCFPLELLPDGLLVSRVQTPQGERVLLTRPLWPSSAP